jgi:hypothetical protein
VPEKLAARVAAARHTVLESRMLCAPSHRVHVGSCECSYASPSGVTQCGTEPARRGAARRTEWRRG